MAHLLEFADEAYLLSVGVLLALGLEFSVVVEGPCAEEVVGNLQDLAANSDGRSFPPAAHRQSVMTSCQLGLFGPCCRLRRLDQRTAQPGLP